MPPQDLVTTGLDTARLSVSFDRVLRVLRRSDLPGDLSAAAASVLYTLVHGGPSRLTALAGAEHVSQPAMTQLIGRLELSGLVSRSPDPDDGRAVVVAATDAGRELGERRRIARAEALAALIEDAGTDAADHLAMALPTLERMARVGDARHPPG